MSTVSDIEISLVQHAVCEIRELEKGNMSKAGKMLSRRRAAYNRLYIAKCYRDTYSENKSLVDYLLEQCKEIVLFIKN